MIQILEYINKNYTWFLCGAIVILLAIIGYYADKILTQNKNKDKNTEEENKIGLSDITNSNSNNKNDEVVKSEKTDEVSNSINSVVEENNFNAINISSNEVPIIDEGVFIEEKKSSNLVSNINEKASIEVRNSNSEAPVISENISIVEENINNQSSTLDENINQVESLVNNKENNTDIEQIDNFIENKITDFNVKNKEKKNFSDNILLTDKKIEKLDKELNTLLPKKETISTDLLDDIDDLDLDTKIKSSNFMDIPDLDNIKLPKIKNLVDKENDIWKF